jgi:hypothetical protein
MDTPSALQNRAVFRRSLAALGYVEGKNVVIEERSAEGNQERLRELGVSSRRSRSMSSLRQR